MDYPYINIHTHRRTGTGIEVVSVMAGEHGAADTVIARCESPKQSGFWPAPPFSVGIHPWQLAEIDETALVEALREVETAPASAIGEIGLDYAVPGDHGEQNKVFAACLRIAEVRGLPVILHCVRAFEPTMEILAEYSLPAVIFHGFVGSTEQAVRAVKAGYYLSFGERSLNSPKTVEAMRAVPLANMFLETDDSSMPIAGIYTRAAALLAMPVPQLVKQLYENYERLVGKNRTPFR